MRKILLTMMVCGGMPGLMAQQEPQFNLYMFNQTAINPAAAGVKGGICTIGFGRSQWMGMEDQDGNAINPRTYGLTFDMPVYRIKSGVGLTVQYDQIGFEKNLDVKAHYAYHHVFRNNHMLSGGLTVALKNKTIDYSKLQPSGEDPSLPGVDGSGMMTDLGLGIHYNIHRKFYAGVSMSNLLGSSSEIEGPEYQLARYYYAMAGYDFNFEDKQRRPIVLTPGFLLKATQGSVQLDLNAILTWNDLIWGGVMFRMDRAVGAMAGINYNGFSLGISYDYTLNASFMEGSRNSLELFIKYCYPIYPGVVKKSAYNTRNL
jgi:type IX secretion system PorP/SprF family membrane protein